MKTMVVTGGLGFIGSNFIKYVFDHYPNLYQIINIDGMTYAADQANVPDYIKESSRYLFVYSRVEDSWVSKQIVNNVDYVVHFAAESHVDRSIASNLDFIETNVKGTQNMLDCAGRWGVKKFVQISTDEVYGSLGSQGSFSEDSPIAPRNPYAATKAAADHLVMAAFHTYSVPVVITRCSNNYGPRQHEEKFIPKTITNILSGRRVPIYGDGLNVRDWIHVDDHCSAIMAVLEHGALGEIYNIGARNERYNRDIVFRIAAMLEKKYHESVLWVEDRPGHDRRYSVDPSKTEGLGWKPSIGWVDGLKNTVEFYKKKVDYAV